MARKPANDQSELIKAIQDGDRRHAWELVKYIGIKENPDINSRFLLFNKAFECFDAFRNNNFIMYYRNIIKYDSLNNADNNLYKFTNNRNIINALKSQASSPKEDLPEIVRDIEKFIQK